MQYSCSWWCGSVHFLTGTYRVSTSFIVGRPQASIYPTSAGHRCFPPIPCELLCIWSKVRALNGSEYPRLQKAFWDIILFRTLWCKSRKVTWTGRSPCFLRRLSASPFESSLAVFTIFCVTDCVRSGYCSVMLRCLS